VLSCVLPEEADYFVNLGRVDGRREEGSGVDVGEAEAGEGAGEVVLDFVGRVGGDGLEGGEDGVMVGREEGVGTEEVGEFGEEG
jgi:hypothetical protein